MKVVRKKKKGFEVRGRLSKAWTALVTGIVFSGYFLFVAFRFTEDPLWFNAHSLILSVVLVLLAGVFLLTLYRGLWPRMWRLFVFPDGTVTVSRFFTHYIFPPGAVRSIWVNRYGKKGGFDKRFHLEVWLEFEPISQNLKNISSPFLGFYCHCNRMNSKREREIELLENIVQEWNLTTGV